MKNRSGLIRVSWFGIGFTILAVSYNTTRTPLFFCIIATSIAIFSFMLIKVMQNKQ